MTSLISDLKAGFLKYWFYISSLALAITVYLLDSKGKQVAQLNQEVQRMKLGQALAAINEQANQSQEGFNNAKQSYESLVKTHGTLLTRLGVTHTSPSVAPVPSSESPKSSPTN